MRPTLEPIDFGVIAVYFVLVLGLGVWVARKAITGIESFFLGDRQLPWWLSGTSILATTFSADTPLAVTGLVALGGVSANWIWWVWGIAHVVGAFFFARLWRRSGVMTDAELTELRYGGPAAAWLRGFKAIYSGFFLNILTMSWVIAAMIKISQALFDVEPLVVVLASVATSVLYTTIGGFRSVVLIDFVQFSLGMAGAVLLAVVVVDAFGGMGVYATGGTSGGAGLLGAVADVSGRSASELLDLFPGPDHPTMAPAYFLALLLCGWWRNAESGGYAMQRLAACKTEGHAEGASLWFAVMHNAIRPWPWIVVALGALAVFPMPEGQVPETARSTDGQIQVRPASLDLVTGGQLQLSGTNLRAGMTAQLGGQKHPLVAHDGALTADFGGLERSGRMELSVPELGAVVPGIQVFLRDREMAYPLMMVRFLPSGLLGLMVASLLAAFMSTIDTHTNWGASYVVRDVYQRFLRPQASEKELVRVSRASIVMFAVVAGIASLYVDSIAEVWRFLLTLGAGLGSVSLARWFWPRVTPHAEFAAIAVSTVAAVLLPWLKLSNDAEIIGVAALSLSAWIPVALFGPQNDAASLVRFADRVRPPGATWQKISPTAMSAVRFPVVRTALGLLLLLAVLWLMRGLVLGRW
jgi:solute:Na+ symporter, SSS family